MVETTIGATNAGHSDDTGLNNEPQGRDAEPPRISGFTLIEPGDLKFDSPSGESSRRRGRPKGSRNSARSTEKASENNLIENVESLLLSTHFMLAKLLDVPEFELDESEAKRLSDAFKKVAAFYPLGLSPKRLAWAELSIAAGTIYGPRVVTIYKRKPKPSPVRVMPTPQPQPQQQQQSQPSNSQPQSKRPEVPSQIFNQGVIDDLSDQA